jgi:hypothetical protein
VMVKIWGALKFPVHCLAELHRLDGLPGISWICTFS